MDVTNAFITKKDISKKQSIFLDEDEESDDDEIIINKPIQLKPSVVKPIIGDRPLTDYIFANVNNYNFKTWKECFPDNKVSLRSLVFNPAWNEFFNMVESKPYFKGMERILSDYLSKSNKMILPYAELTFNSFNVLSPKQIKAIFIGQDPYTNIITILDKMIPQAMGFSFSVPLYFPKPPSLENIYQNALTFGHIRKIPISGCLSPWILQGCFMINAAFTTFHAMKNAHQKIWENFTNDLLEFINNNCENVVFVVWGAYAHKLCQNIDPKRHHIITSSHPSPLGFDKTLNGYNYGKLKNPINRKQISYPSFKSTDHFGRINAYLRSINKGEIFWDLID